MDLTFQKYQGTGNDFIIFDDRALTFPAKDYTLVKRLCDRKFGIGADGLMLIRRHEEYDFEMVYYNADGYPGSLCGNGSRCAVHYAAELQLFAEEAVFLASDGPHEAYIEQEAIHLKMNDLPQVKNPGDYFFMDTGSPHYVRFVENTDAVDVYEEGRKVRYSDQYKEKGTNVNFVEVLDSQHIFVRTYERGVENETLSCGTGVTAAAIAASFKGLKSPISVRTIGGDLRIAFQRKGKDPDRSFFNIFLIGPAEKVFTGKIKIS